MAPPPDDCSSPPSRSVATVFTLPPRDLCPDQTSSRAISLYSGHSGQSSPPSLTQSAKPRPSLLTCDVRRPALSYFEPTRTRSLRVHEREEEIATATRAQQSDNVDSRGALEGGPDRSSHHCDSFESPSTRRRRLGWDHLAGESHQNGLLRGEVLLALTLLGHEITCKEAIRRFSTFLEDKNSPLLPPDIRKATYTAVMRSVTTADKSGMESLFDVYRNTDTGQEKERILSALASCPDPHIVLEALNFLLSVQVRDQDVIYGLAGISWEGSETAWSWLKDNWDLISERWGHQFLLTHFIRNIITLSSSDERAEEMEIFFQSRTKPSFARNLKQSIEHVRVNAKLVSSMRNEQGLEELIMKLAERS